MQRAVLRNLSNFMVHKREHIGAGQSPMLSLRSEVHAPTSLRAQACYNESFSNTICLSFRCLLRAAFGRVIAVCISNFVTC